MWMPYPCLSLGIVAGLNKLPNCQWPLKNPHFWSLESRHIWPPKVVNYNRIDIPIIATVVTEYDDYKGKLDAGARILNISVSVK